MKRLRILLMMFLIFGVAAGQVLAGEETVRLKMADYFPIGHLGHKTALRFIDRISELSGGKIQIDYYPAQQLGKAQDLLRMCAMGAADIAGVAPSLFAGQVPLNTVIVSAVLDHGHRGDPDLYPAHGDQSGAAGRVFCATGVRPIVTVTTSQYDVGTVAKPVRRPEDLRGLRLKSSGGIFVKIAKRYRHHPREHTGAGTLRSDPAGNRGRKHPLIRQRGRVSPQRGGEISHPGTEDGRVPFHLPDQ